MNTIPRTPLDDLVDAADALHEACSGYERLAQSEAWMALGTQLDKWKPLPFWRNTGSSRIADEALPLEMP